MEDKKVGTVKVMVQTEERLRIINNLSLAILQVAEALNSNTIVEIKDNIFNGGGVSLTSVDDVEKTEIKIEREEDGEFHHVSGFQGR